MKLKHATLLALIACIANLTQHLYSVYTVLSDEDIHVSVEYISYVAVYAFFAISMIIFFAVLLKNQK